MVNPLLLIVLVIILDKFLKQKSKEKEMKLDTETSKKVWEIFISHMKDTDLEAVRATVWELCNDVIYNFPELEKEEELLKEFVELYDPNFNKVG